MIDAEAATFRNAKTCDRTDMTTLKKRICLDAKVTTLSGPSLCLGLALEHFTDVGKLSVPFVMEGGQEDSSRLQVRCEAVKLQSSALKAVPH